MKWLEILSVVGMYLLIFGGFFVALSFMGGFAGAVAAGGREDRSLPYNFGIGFLGWLAASLIWTGRTGHWPDEVSAGMIALTFVASMFVALFANWRERRQADSGGANSPSESVSV